MSLDMTRGNPARLILLFALPLFVGNLFQQLYNMADTLIVGRALGAQALAAVGCTGSLSFLILGFAQGLTSGFSVVLAQRTGARDAEGVRRSYGCAILLTGLATLLITPAAVALCGPLLELLRTPADILPQAQAYISIIFGGMFASLLFNLLGNTLRALGDSRTPLYFLVAASVVNIVLDILLITRFSMGVQGAALATVAAQLVSGGLCLWYIGRRFPQLKLSPRHFLPGPAEVWAHLRIGLPMAFQTCLISIGTLILQAAVNGLGADAVAAFTAGNRLEGVFTMPLVSFGTTMATYTAQNYGAQDYRRIALGLRQCLTMALGYSVAAAAVSIGLGRQLAGLFLPGQAEVARLAHIYLIMVGIGYCSLAVLYICRFSLQGLGRGAVPTAAGVVEMAMRMVAALLLTAPFGMAGACSAAPLAWTASAIPLAVALWREVRILLGRAQPRPQTAAR